MDLPMTVLKHLLGVIFIGLLVVACSSTKTTESWSDQSYTGQIKNAYIIGIAKDDLNRMIFEDNFESRLISAGIKAIASYKDNLPTNQEVNREDIIQRMRNNNCDSILLTRLISTRTKATISGGQGSYTYTPGSYSRGLTSHRLPKDSPYSSWSNYYRHGTVNYVAPSKADFVILTVESVLYDLQTEELIWSAQLETRLEGNFENMVQTFVDEVTRDLKEKGLI
jgi:hypothetical protein